MRIESQKQPTEEPCPCGCGRMVKKNKNRNGKEKVFFDDKCRARWYSQARNIGKQIMVVKLPAAEVQAFIDAAKGLGPGKILIRDKGAIETRRKRQEYVDLEGKTKQERLGALCRAAENMKVLF